ncbi:DUF6894 family protein [Methylobacterium sp. J-076]|uniref:DUF6894 family protein n=1 Tax=Methylobacterium sp. J-076 TaxID=2836655 RepID=UPI001FB89C5C|nr:hypothetical protein [Methylobacterium sp. J-076]MCJ2013538.1 hypothetical protein [Methylobacterium sp. J-076]
MPRYFFHTHIGDDVVVDPDGRELDDADAAWEAAKVLAVQLLQGAAADPELLRAVLFVADEAGEIVLEFPLTDALAAEPMPSPEDGTIH